MRTSCQLKQGAVVSLLQRPKAVSSSFGGFWGFLAANCHVTNPSCLCKQPLWDRDQLVVVCGASATALIRS